MKPPRIVNLYQFLKNRTGFSKKLDCKDFLFTQYDCPQTERKMRFYIECNLIVFVISGKRIFHKDGNKWTLTPGTCVFIKKGTHISEREEGDGWCVMSFFMPDDFLKALITENHKKLPLANLPPAEVGHIFPFDVNDFSRSFFLSMQPYFTQVPPPPELLVELKFKELILSLLTNRKNDRFLSFLNDLRDDKSPSIQDVMKNNYHYNLSLTEYATLACKSVPTFKREFKRIFNDSPAKWVMKKRISLAAELLQNTTLSISEISYECGFENQTHFSRMFKQRIGTPPLQYRISGKAIGINQLSKVSD